MSMVIVKQYISLIVLPLATLVYAQDTPFYITSPLQGTIYKAGETATIRWINGIDEEAKVRLLQETGTSPLQPSGYEFTVQGDKGHHDWQTPSDLEPDASYALQFIYQNSDDDDTTFSYSGRFSITGGNATHQHSATSSSSTKASTAVIPGATTSSSPSSSVEKKSNDHSDSSKDQEQQQDHVTGASTSLNPVALTILQVSSLFSIMAVSWSI
ncbi:hypothetical protein LRAMOSA04061 [Lichtheimia ramosa]|uniref:Yeast cell wall synthesis Kre9/Knh1-like N-terminal domain-containing protein n=1 Tax=Lichtheimia ramosa TaxID=688394 RepID=A0A077WX90_9FUNG|nr:hypothetical protein LRAMOSA04061 [Lichtheimia ramosa]